jgi:prepilin-type N-terminal cleavage/methylation domain-containing protein
MIYEEVMLIDERNTKKGFTLAELLVVVAIMGVLVAVSIPIFSSQINKAKLATNRANIRAAKAAVSEDYTDTGVNGNYYLYGYDINTGSLMGVLSTNSGKISYLNESQLAKGTAVYMGPNGFAEQAKEKGIYTAIFVIISDNGIKTCPYFDVGTGTIKSDVFQ